MENKDYGNIILPRVFKCGGCKETACSDCDAFQSGAASRDAEVAELQAKLEALVRDKVATIGIEVDGRPITITGLSVPEIKEQELEATKQECRREVVEWVTNNFLKVKFPAWYPDSPYGKAWAIQLKEWLEDK